MRSGLTVLLVAALGAAALASGCAPRQREFPPALLGTWTASTAPYTDRVMVIEPGEVRFGIRGGALESFPISRVEPPVEGGDGSCLIGYLDRTGGEHTLRLIYEAQDGGRLRLRHRPGPAWTRRKRT